MSVQSYQRHEDVNDDDGPNDVCEIPEQIDEAFENGRKNKNCQASCDGDVFYKDINKGTRISGWAGQKQGETKKVGLATISAKNGLYECEVTAGELAVGVTKNDDQLGIETEFTTISTKKKYGHLSVGASALGAGYDVGIGRNTGAFVRGNVVSVGGSVGPLGCNVGLGLDTGARTGADGVEVKVLGTGFMFDRNEGIEVSFFGNSCKFKL